MPIPTKLSPQENYKYNGFIPEAQLEELFDAYDALAGAKDAAVYIDEISPSVEEDFILDELESLQDLSKRLRGENRKELLKVISEIEEKVKEAIQIEEHNSEMKRKALDQLVDLVLDSELTS